MNDVSATKRWETLFVMLVSLVLFGSMVPLPAAAVDTNLNNFSMLDSGGGFIGGTNTVHFTWDGTGKTSVDASGQISNATISSPCLFFGTTWLAHDVAIYGPGTYTVYDGCAAGSPGCGSGNAVTFTVGAGQLGGHMLFYWNGNDDIDVVDVWETGVFAPSAMWTGACGTGDPAKVWDLMSTDWDLDGINGAPMTDGPFSGSNANFNLMGRACNCDDGNPCTIDTCDTATGACSYVNEPDDTGCDDGDYDACTTGVCSSGTCVAGPALVCNDNNLCTTDNCDPEIGCYYTATVCNDNNLCTTDSCDTATGNCVFANNTVPCILDGVSCMQGACSGGSCALGESRRTCDDNNPCTDDSCSDATFTCVNANKPDLTACDDGNTCTLNDQCTAGSCSGTATADCLIHGRLMVEAGSYFCMGAAYPGGTCVALAAGVDGGVVLGQYQPTQLDVLDPAKPDVCGNNAGSGIGTGYGFTDIGGPVAIAQPFGFFGTPTYISTDPVSWQACNVHNAPSAQTGAVIPSNGCFKITADMSAWEVFWNGSVFEQGPRPALNATGRLCSDNSYRLTWPALIVGGPFSGVTGYWLLVGHHNQCDVSTCDDGNVCTDDSFNSVGCQCNHDNNTASCTGNACITGDVCSDGICGTPITCNDNNACTTDSCNTSTGCVYTPIDITDTDLCTTDTCDPATGIVTHAAIVCNDNNACTTDICNSASGCVYTPIVGCGATKVSIFADGTWFLDVNGSGVWDGIPNDALYTFGGGVAGAVPVTGNWTSMGATRIGIYADGAWYLDLNGNGIWDGTPTDALYTFGGGVAGAVPVTGDWTGTGITRLGIYADGAWYLDINGNGVWDGTPDDALYFFGGGIANAVPVTGDWTGSGTTKIGIFADGVWYLDSNGSGAWDGMPTDGLLSFGEGVLGAVPVTGNWTGTGATKIGIYANGIWYLDSNGSGAWDGTPTDGLYGFGGGLTGAVPVTGKW